MSNVALANNEDALLNCTTNSYESPVVDTEYISPHQHGGIHGVVYRQYFNTTLPSTLTTGDTAGKLIDYCCTVDATAMADRHVIHGYNSDGGGGESYIRLDGVSGHCNMVMAIGGLFTINDGWVDYTK